MAEKLNKLKMLVLPAIFGRHVFYRADFEAPDSKQVESLEIRARNKQIKI